MLARGEERGKISGAKDTLKPEELHWVEAILPTLVVGVAVIGALANVVLDALSVDVDNEIRLRDVGERTGWKHWRVVDSTMS